MYKKEKNVLHLFVQKKVTVLLFVHSIAWTCEQIREDEIGQSPR